MNKTCDHSYHQAWFYNIVNSKRFQCIKCGKIINSKTYNKIYVKQLKKVQNKLKRKK